eukprot:592556-Alexandrium_andersonii.AAC.1
MGHVARSSAVPNPMRLTRYHHSRVGGVRFPLRLLGEALPPALLFLRPCLVACQSSQDLEV